MAVESAVIAPTDDMLFAALEDAKAAVSRLSSVVSDGGFSGAGRLRALDELQHLVNQLQAALVQDVRQLDEAGDWRRHGARNLADFVKHRLRLEATGWKYATLARNFGRIPKTGERFASGGGNIEQAYDCWSGLKELPQSVPDDANYDDATLADVWAAADECLAEKTSELNGSQLKTCAEHILAGLDAEAHQRIKDYKAKRQGLSVSRLNDQTVISGTASAAEGETLERALRNTEAWAKNGTGDTRSPRRRRLDALMEMARHFLDCGQTPRRKNARYHLVVHAELNGLIGALQHAVNNDSGQPPARGGQLDNGARRSGQHPIPGTGDIGHAASRDAARADPLDIMATLLATFPVGAPPGPATRPPTPPQVSQTIPRPCAAGGVLLEPDPSSRSAGYRAGLLGIPLSAHLQHGLLAGTKPDSVASELARQIIDAQPLISSLLRTNPLSPAHRLESGAILGYRDLLEALTDPNGTDITRVITGPAGSVPRTWPGPHWPGPGAHPTGGSVHPPSESPETSGTVTHPVDATGRMAALIRGMLALLPPALGAPSELLDVGRTERFHTRPMRLGVAVRDGARCAVPGCGMPAEYLQAHHVRQWHQHGRTNTGEAALACGVHNRAVEAGAILYRDQGGHWIYHPPPDSEPARSNAA